MLRSISVAWGIALGLLMLLLTALPYPSSFLLPTLAHAAPVPDATFQSGEHVLAEPDPSVISFTLSKDEVDGEGRWIQTYVMLIKSGGTLADASELIYGSSEHIDELFGVIKQRYPELRGPAQVPANLVVELPLDPRVAFVPQSVTVDAGRGATIFTYYNGARRTVYDPKRSGDHKGLSQYVDLPADRPTKTFTILEDSVPREVPAGVRVAYYDFQVSDDLKSVVTELYGSRSLRAINHFLNQTQWDPNRWPPKTLERSQRLVIPLNDRFEDPPFTPLNPIPNNQVSAAAVNQLQVTRANAGIYPIGRRAYGTVYRVVASDFNLTARQVSQLIFGSDGEYLSIAAESGFAPLRDLTASPPEDVRLFGRSFDVLVDYEREWFPNQPSVYDEASRKHSTLLLNGTLIEEWQLEAGKSGILRQISLPSGYRKILFRPQTITTMAGQILYSLVNLGRAPENPQVRQEEEGGFVSGLVWNWGRTLPRRSGDVLEYGRLMVVATDQYTKDDELIEVAVRPSTEDASQILPFYRPWLDSPFFFGIIAVLLALIMVGGFGWIARRV